MNKLLLLIPGILFFGMLACAPTAGSTPTTTAAAPQKAAWEQQWNDWIAGAKGETKLTVYSSANPATREAVAKTFKERHGITVEFVSGKGSELVERLLRESSAGIRLADVIIVGAPDLINVIKPTGALAPIKPVLILPEVLDTRVWLGDKLPLIDRDGQVAGFIAQYLNPVLSNSDLVREDQVKSFYDLLKPEWKGKMLMSDPTVTGFAKTWVSYMMLRGLGMEKGRDYMEKLVKQEPLIVRDDRLLVEWVARGKYPLVLGPLTQLVKEMRDAGLPLKFLRMSEGGFVQHSGGALALVAQRSSPNASHLFVNWLLSREGQTVFASNYGIPSFRQDVSREGLDSALIPLPGEKVATADEEWYLGLARVSPVISEIFKPLLK